MNRWVGEYTSVEARRIAANVAMLAEYSKTGDPRMESLMTTLTIDGLNRDLLKNRSIVILKWKRS